MTQAISVRRGIQSTTFIAAINEIIELLKARAKFRGMMTYAELVSKMTTVQLQPDSYALFEMLGEASIITYWAEGYMITALVVHKVGDQEPGNGFFQLAKDLGETVIDQTLFWVEQVKKTHAANS